MKKATLFFAAAVLAVAVAAAPAYAGKAGGGGGGGSPASNKAMFGTGYQDIMFTKFNNNVDCGDTEFDQPNDKLCTAWQELYEVPYALKTSTVGGVGVYVSLECALWTDSESAAMIGGSGSGGSRAGIEIRVWIADNPEFVGATLAEPGAVVFCDRLQYTKLTIPELLVNDDPLLAVTSEDPFVLRLFQRTKSAHAFNFYQATGAMEVAVLVETRGIVQCFKDGVTVTCSESGIDIPKFIDGDTGQLDGGTKAAIGKSTFVIEEHQNWSTSN